MRIMPALGGSIAAWIAVMALLHEALLMAVVAAIVAAAFWRDLQEEIGNGR